MDKLEKLGGDVLQQAGKTVVEAVGNAAVAQATANASSSAASMSSDAIDWKSLRARDFDWLRRVPQTNVMHGTRYIVRHQPHGHEYMCTIILPAGSPSVTKQQQIARYDYEVTLMTLMPPHPNISGLLGRFDDALPTELPNEAGGRMSTLAAIAGSQRAAFFLSPSYTCSLQQLINDRKELHRVHQIAKDTPLFAMNEILHIGAQVSNGLCHLQDYGIAHRDLTPDNIMVSTPDTTGLLGAACHMVPPTIAIAGFACALDMSRNDWCLYHRTDRDAIDAHQSPLAGTLEYRAPELLATTDGGPMRRHQCYYDSDEYSLGLILHYCLTGEPPRPHPESVYSWRITNRPFIATTPPLERLVGGIIRHATERDPSVRASRQSLLRQCQQTPPPTSPKYLNEAIASLALLTMWRLTSELDARDHAQHHPAVFFRYAWMVFAVSIAGLAEFTTKRMYKPGVVEELSRFHVGATLCGIAMSITSSFRGSAGPDTNPPWVVDLLASIPLSVTTFYMKYMTPQVLCMVLVLVAYWLACLIIGIVRRCGVPLSLPWTHYALRLVTAGIIASRFDTMIAPPTNWWHSSTDGSLRWQDTRWVNVIRAMIDVACFEVAIRGDQETTPTSTTSNKAKKPTTATATAAIATPSSSPPPVQLREYLKNISEQVRRRATVRALATWWLLMSMSAISDAYHPSSSAAVST